MYAYIKYVVKYSFNLNLCYNLYCIYLYLRVVKCHFHTLNVIIPTTNSEIMRTAVQYILCGHSCILVNGYKWTER